MIRVLVAILASGALAAPAAAQGPPPPTAPGGQTVTLVAHGVPTPTAFAFAGGTTFVSGFGDEQHPKVTGGVYVLHGGKAVRVPGSPPHVFGLAYASGTMYLSAGRAILAWSGWNGHRFQKTRVVTTGPKGFGGFNGLAVGPDHMIYVGAGLPGMSKAVDSKQGTTPDANDFLSVDPTSGAITVVATGIRQPWQPVFVPGQSLPLVSDLGQENLGKKLPPDYVLAVAQGADFGFPSCPATPSTCSGYTKPFAQFPAHASPMGLAVAGGTLYVALFGGMGKGPEVVSMPTAGGAPKPFVTGYAAPVVAVGTAGGKVYTGDLTGTIYSVTR